MMLSVTRSPRARRLTIQALGLAALWAAGAATRADEPSELEVPQQFRKDHPDGKLPPLESYQNSSGKVLPFGQGASHATFVTRAGAPLRPRPDAGAQPYPQRMEFLQVVKAFDQQRNFFLVGEPDPGEDGRTRLLGWASGDDIQPGLWTLKLERDADGTLRSLDVEKGLSSKGFLVMPLQVVLSEKEARRGLDELITTRQAPRDDAPKAELVKLYGRYPIWKRVEDAKGNAWVLIGRVDSMGDLKLSLGPLRAIVGWVPETRIKYWPTAICLEDVTSNRAARRGLPYQDPSIQGSGLLLNAYRDLDSLLAIDACVRSPKDCRPDRIQLVDSENLESKPKAFYDERYPLLDQGTLPEINGGTPRWVKMGLIGPVVGEDGLVITASEYTRSRKVAGEMAEGAKKIEVVFVIDDTGSMGPVFNRATDIVLGLQARLDAHIRGRDSKDRPTLRYKLVRYRDFCEAKKSGERNYQFKESSVRCDEDVQKVRDALALPPAGPLDGIGGRPLEAVFHAVLLAIGGRAEPGEEEPIFEKYSQRVLFLIGDDGSHLPDGMDHNLLPGARDGEPPREKDRDAQAEALRGLKEDNPEPHTVAELAEALLSKKVAFHAIQVASANEVPGRIFREQMNEIVRRCGAGIGPDSEFAGYFYSFAPDRQIDKNQVEDVVFDRVKKTLEANDVVRGMLARFAQGEPLFDQLDTATKEALKKAGGDLSKLEGPALSFPAAVARALLDGQQLKVGFQDVKSQVAYDVHAFELHPASPREEHRLLARRVFVSKSDVRRMHQFLEQIKLGLSEGLSKIVKQAVAQNYAEKINEEQSVADAIGKITPFPLENPIFKIPLKDIDNPEVVAKYLPDLFAVEDILRSRLDGTDYQVLERDKRTNRALRVKQLKQPKVIWILRNGDVDDPWAYLGLDETP